MSNAVLLLWIVVILELVSPVPAILSFGAIYVLMVRPPWFLRLVQELYAGSGDDQPPVEGVDRSKE